MNLHINYSQARLEEFVQSTNLPVHYADRLMNPSNQVDFIEGDDFLFVILLLPEYNGRSKSIEAIEVDILYNKKSSEINVFAFKSDYFFLKYTYELSQTKEVSLDQYLIKFLEIVFKRTGLVPQAFDEDTVRSPPKKEEPKDTVITLLPCPLVIVAPVGTVQL